MKKTYIMPTAEEILLSSTAIMITGSGGGEQIVGDGGDTETAGITEGDSRRHRSVWDDGMEEEDEFLY